MLITSVGDQPLIAGSVQFLEALGTEKFQTGKVCQNVSPISKQSRGGLKFRSLALALYRFQSN